MESSSPRWVVDDILGNLSETEQCVWVSDTCVYGAGCGAHGMLRDAGHHGFQGQQNRSKQPRQLELSIALNSTEPGNSGFSK